MFRLGLPFEMEKQYAYARFSLQSGYTAMEYLLKHCPDITAVFAMSDLMALGAIRALNDHGLRVPQDISVSGYDGIALGRYSNPRLTTIRQNSERLAQRGAEILLNCIENGSSAVHEVVPFELIEDESVAALPNH
jgi:LacI family transcriptional regulator